EVVVADSEPGLLAIAGQGLDHGPRLTGHTPAALVIEPVGEHVHDRIVVWHHEQSVTLGVVAGVDDDGQLAPAECRLQALGQLRAAGPARQGDDVHAVTWPGARRRATSGRWSRGRTAQACGR